jgi:hypothetical protein
MNVIYYRTSDAETIRVEGKEGSFPWTIPSGTVFEMPPDWQPDDNSLRVEIDWLRAQREHTSLKKLKQHLRIELRLLRAGDAFGYDPGDLDDLRPAVIAMHRAGEFGASELGEFLEELKFAEDRMRRIYRRRA